MQHRKRADIRKELGTACEFLDVILVGWKVFVIRLLYKTFKEKLKIQRHHPFKLGFGFTITCLMIVYEDFMKRYSKTVPLS